MDPRELEDAGLVGDPPQIQVWDDVLIVAVRRNHGIELNRIEMGSGNAVWERGAAFIDADRVTLTNADADGDRCVRSSRQLALRICFEERETCVAS